MGHIYTTGVVPGTDSLGPGNTEPNLIAATEYFERAKIVASGGKWAGPPKDYIELKAAADRPKEKIVVDHKKLATESGSMYCTQSSKANLFWDNALYASIIAVVVSFGIHFYRKLMHF